MVKSIYYLLFILFLYSCSNKEVFFVGEINSLVRNIHVSEFSNLYGISARKMDVSCSQNKDHRKPAMMFTDKSGFRYHSYYDSLESTISMSSFDPVLFTREVGHADDESVRAITEYACQIYEITNKYNLYEISSMKNLGHFVVFGFTENISVYYKEKGAFLNSTYQNSFKHSLQIAPNWYLLKDETNKEIYKMFEKKLSRQ